mmetsp:Transcript_9155/g.10116  ORF Transcript_9155/g.10116 Transcript_9155/m.10116 type:complete len:435 (-) Transcript_9155:275-1579(-)
MKLTASLLSVFAGIGVGVASAAAGDQSGHSLRSLTDPQNQIQRSTRLLQDGSPEMEAGNGAVTTGGADMKKKDDAGFNQDTCQNIAQIACGGDFQELCDHLSTSSSTLGKELTGGSWTVFFPTDQAFRDIEDNVIQKFDDEKVNQLLLFHVIENQELTFDDLTCTEKVLMYNGKYSRTKCEYNLIESDRQRAAIKHQNGSGNNKMGNKPVIIRSTQACNGIIHIVDSLMLPFTPKLIGDDDMGGDPGFGIGTIEECCVNKGGAYRPSQNADGSVSQWCDYEGTLYEGIFFWSVECEGINDDECIEEAYGDDESVGDNAEDDCLDCCIDHYEKRFTKCDIDYGNPDASVPSTEFGDALQRCDTYNIRAYIMCGSNCVEGCDIQCNADYKQCMRICATIYGTEGDECRVDCIQDVSNCHNDCHGVAMDYFDDKAPF